MEVGAEISIISINDIRERYGIKQSAAYKWRTALRNLGMEESWESYDRIKSREINLSEAAKGSAIAVQEKAVTTTTAKPKIEACYEETAPIFGISPERLAEINATVELEVMVEDVLYEHHRQKKRAERAQKIAATAKEVSELDPKEIVRRALEQISRVA